MDEKNESGSDEFQKASEIEAELESDLDGLSSDEEDATAAASDIKPYSALLQSLNGNTQRGQPQRKKRKKSEYEVSVKIDDRDGVDLVIEPEEREDLGIGEIHDEDRNDEVEKGALLPYFLGDPAYVLRS